MELPYPPTTVQLINNRTKEATEKMKQAKEALNEAAQATPPDSYQIGDQVWLEAKHLAHQQIHTFLLGFQALFSGFWLFNKCTRPGK